MALTLETYLPENAIFPVASTLILGDREAILVDAQFQASRARELVERIRASGSRLTTVFVSHSDPDYYFALDTIHAAFPEARILATPQTAWLIGATKDAKMGVWKDQLGEDAPQTLIVPEPTNGPLEIEGETVEIRQSSDDPAHSFLWVPSLGAVIGGVSIFAGAHPWMADTPDLAALDKWLAQLDAMQTLNPEIVVAGHGGDGTNAPGVIAAQAAYLRDWRAAAETAQTAKDIIQPMAAKYPGLAGRESLDMGAGVFTGEIPWHRTEAYPPIGRSIVVDFGAAQFRLSFPDNRRLTFTDIGGQFGGLSDTCDYIAVPVAPGVFMVYWSEPNTTGSNVVHVQDYGNGIVHTNIAGRDGSFTNLSGTLSLE